MTDPIVMVKCEKCGGYSLPGWEQHHSCEAVIAKRPLSDEQYTRLLFSRTATLDDLKRARVNRAFRDEK